MATQKTVDETIMISKVSEYLAFNDSDANTFLKGGFFDPQLPLMITCERLSVEWMRDVNPSEPAIQSCADYLYALLGPYAQQAEIEISNTQGAKPIVSGPSNQTISMSGLASFTITVTSPTQYVISWYKNGVLVLGQNGLNYSYAATFANNGDQVQAIVTNSAGSTPSSIAILTVTNTYTAYFHFGDDDEYANISAGVDGLTYQYNVTMTPADATFSFNLSPEASNNRWDVIKYPTAWGTVNEFFNTFLNNGMIPGAEFYEVVFIGSNSYICSRNALSFDPNSDLTLKRP